MPNSPNYLFLSHNSQDKPEVIKFAKSLELHPLAIQHNLQVWLDKDELHNRSYFPDQLVDAIRVTTCAFALYLSNQEITPWIETEISHALKRHVDDQKYGKNYPLIPFYAHSREGATPLPLITMSAIDNVFGDMDKIEYIIKQAIGVNNTQQLSPRATREACHF